MPDILPFLPPASERRLITTKQAASLMSLGVSTFQRHRAAGKIGPAPIKLGKSTRWDRAEFDKWIDAGCPNVQAWKVIKGSFRPSPRSTR